MNGKAKIVTWIIAIPTMLSFFMMFCNIAFLAPTMLVVVGVFEQVFLLITAKITLIEAVTKLMAIIAVGVFMWAPLLFGQRFLKFFEVEGSEFEGELQKAFFIEIGVILILGAIVVSIVSRL